eukprot:scaffold922_cov327-Pinguiococcus_pyrenoidosus.AAC.25
MAVHRCQDGHTTTLRLRDDVLKSTDDTPEHVPGPRRAGFLLRKHRHLCEDLQVHARAEMAPTSP